MDQTQRRATLPRSVRLRSRRAFRHVFNEQLNASDRWLTVHAARNDVGITRLGISVRRRIGPAIRRNRFKRLLREAFRQIRWELPPGMDWIVVPKPGPEPTLPVLRRSLHELARRICVQGRA